MINPFVVKLKGGDKYDFHNIRSIEIFSNELDIIKIVGNFKKFGKYHNIRLFVRTIENIAEFREFMKRVFGKKIGDV